MESGVVPDITYTYAPALWDQNGYALEVQSLYDEIGKSGGGWLDLADGSSKTTAGKRIAIPRAKVRRFSPRQINSISS